MGKYILLVALIAAAACSGCAVYSHATFAAWQGPSVFEGKGGAKRTVDGIDFWTSGLPPRKFRVLGTLQQTNIRDGTAISVLASMTSEQALAAKARKHGGDAIIFLSESNQLLGFSTSPNYGAYYSGYYGPRTGQAPLNVNASTANQRQVVVVKYL